MRVGDAFPSRFIKAQDVIEGKNLTIASVTSEMIGRGAQAQTKPVLHFSDSAKSLPLNITNARAVAEVAGTDDFESWAGVRIVLYADRVLFGAQMVSAVRVRLPDRGASRQLSAPMTPPRHPPPAAPNNAPPAAPPNGAGIELKAAKAEAWRAWAASRPAGEPADVMKAGILSAVRSYFNGRPPESLGIAEWKQLVADKFVKPPPELAFDPPGTFAEDDIPF